jgi:hypothetical protein
MVPGGGGGGKGRVKNGGRKKLSGIKGKRKSKGGEALKGHGNETPFLIFFFICSLLGAHSKHEQFRICFDYKTGTHQAGTHWHKQ